MAENLKDSTAGAKAGEADRNSGSGEKKDQGGAEEHDVDFGNRGGASFQVGRRQGMKAAKQKAKEGEGTGEDKGEGEEGEKPVLNEDSEEAIAEALDPVVGAQRETADKLDVMEYLQENPDDKKYLASVRKLLAKPEFKAVPIAMLFNAVARVLERKAKAKEAANEEAKGSALAGSGKPRTAGGEEIPDVNQMSDADVEKMISGVKAGK